MRKEIITRIIVWIVTIVIILLGGYAVKEFVIDRPVEPEAPSVEYTLDTEAFGGVVVYNETIDLSKLTITKTENGVKTEIPVDASMITTPVDTTRVGASMLKLSYAGQEFSVPVTVKYKVQFATDDGVFETIYTLSSSELDEIEAPQKEGYTFLGWSKEIPDILFENMHLVANYEAIIPSLPTVEATYGDKLADIKLPDNAAGAWKLDHAEGTVGDAGRRTFDVSFIEKETNEVLKTAKLIVNVARRAVKIDVFADFTYNGKRQEPTYTTDIDVKITAWWDGNKNYTDAGEYSYHFEVDDSNYVGEAKGTYVIKPAVVTVEIKDAQIFANEALPKIEYQISGLEGMSQEQLAEFVGLTIVYPQSVVVGEHKITAKASNPSIQLEVKDGTLKVIQATLEGIGDPVLLSKVATYEDLIGSIGFEMHPNGKWIWETPDAAVGTVGKQKHTAIFVPSNSAYEQIKCEVEITVIPKPMVIEVVGNTTFDYDGTDHNLSVIVKDEAGTLYDTLEVLGNDLCQKAGTYTITLTLADPNYSATKVVTLTINKVNPETDFTQVFTAVWSATLKLSDVKLPTGYAWANPDKRIETAGTESYAVIFTPADTDNYNTVTGEFKLEVAKATAKINNVEDSYSFTYNGSAFTLDRVTRPHEESTLEFAYFKDGKPVASMIEAGVYTVKITLPESKNYKLAEATTTVTINPATNTDNVNTSQTATYGDLAQSVIKLPESTIGTWSIKGADENTTVGNFGENKFVLLFTPTTQNYSTREVEITVTVAKKQINPPAISADKREQVYAGQTLTSGLQNGEGYVITDNGGINVDTYTVTVALASTNYIWSDGTTADKTLSYKIVKASVTISDLAIENWTYGQTAKTPSVNATFGVGESLIYKYYSNAECTDEIGVPSNAGTYYIKAYFAGDDNLKEAWSDRVTFVIKKQVLDLPGYTKEYTYTGETIKANIPGSTLYTVTDSGHITAGDYVATVTLTDSNNYEWAGEAASNKMQALYYSIVAADIGLNNLRVPDITYGEELAPEVDKNFKVNVTFKYSTTQDGEYTTTVPSAAGKYYVIAEFAGNQNIKADKIGPVSFEIKKAQATIQGVRDDKTYTTTYNGSAYSITGVTASNNAELLFTYNGATFTGVTNAGTYVVTITLPESDNFKGDEVDVTIVIKAATNGDTVTDSYDATYGDLVKDIITLPGDNEGSWSLEGVDDTTTVGNAGTRTFTAVFTPDATGNYEERKVTITIEVAPKKIVAPTIADAKKEQSYTGSKLTSGLQNGEGYTVVDEGGIYVGSYTVTVALENSNYIWSDGTSTSKVYTYKIVASENTQEIVTTYNATYGDLLKDVVTLPTGVEGTWSIENFATATVGNAGTNTFTAIFEPDEHGDYTRREVTITIHVAKATVSAPAIDQNKLSQVYTGNKLTSGLTVADDALYTIVDNGGTAVDTYYATISLKDSANYKWNTTGKSDDIKLEYAITKAQITFTSAVNLGGWTFGGTANTPAVTTNFPCALTYVYATKIDGTYTEAQPTNAGTYYVKAIAASDDNLIGGESDAVSFTIAKAPVTIDGGENSYSKTYNGNVFELPSVTTSNGADLSSVVITLNGTTVVDAIRGAGNYTITYKLAESGNYLEAERTITVTVEKADVTISDLDIDDWTFGDTAKQPTAVATPNVALTYKYFSDAACNNEIAAPTNAGTYYVKAYFAGNDNYNATETETAVSFTIAKKVVTTPTVPNASVVYNGKTQNSGLTNTLIYTVADGGHKNKGTYDVILTLVNSANYAWNDVNNANTTVTVQYTITEGTNAISNVSYTANWTYGQTVSAFSAKATYGDIAIKYLVGSEWTEVRPSNAGTYQVVFSTTDENCPIISTDPYTFTIAKAAPVFSGAENTYTDTYDGEAFDLPTVTVSSGASITRVIKLGSTTVDAIVGAGLYNVTYSVAENENYTAGTMTVSVQISPAVISFTEAPVIENWTFNTEAKLPIVKVTQSFVNEAEEVYYEYRRCLDEENNVWTDWTRWGVATFDVRSTMGVPTEAGKYQLRAKVEENVNYANAATLESEIITFTIAKADPSIENVAANKSYTSTYTGNVYTIPGLSASYTGAPALEYAYTKKNVTTGLFETVSEIRGAGEYSVTVTLPESANYNETDVVVTVTIQKADVTISTITGIDGWTYGDVADTPSATANFGMTGSLVFKYATAIDGVYAEGVPTNAGTYFVKAYFAGTTNLNEAWSAATEFTIAKASVTVPSVSNKPYNKETQTSGLTAGTGYVVKAGTDNGGKNVGDYTVTVSLASNNYIWADGTTADKELTYKITPIDNEQDITTSYTTTFGTSISLIQLPANVEGTWSIEGNPTTVGNAGTNTFVAVFTPDTTGNYNSRRVTITVTVGKTEIPVPSYTNKYTYTGSAIEFVIQNPNWDLYEISGHQQTNVGSYNATLTLKDSSNYVWSGNNTLSYTIEKAKITISDLAIIGWTYSEAAKTPTYTVTFSDKCTVSFEYFDEEGNSLGSTAPTDAGNYSVKAKATATDTHNLSDSDVSDPVEFTIAKKDASITANATYTTTYTGNAYTIPGVTASHSESTLQYTVNDVLNGSIIDVKTYTVVITLPESTNYNKAEVTVTVTVGKANVTISAPTIQGWTFGEAAKTPSATADFDMTSSLVFKYATAIGGEYTHTVPTNAGTYYVKAYFAGNTNLNEAWSAATEFTIAKATIQVPTVDDKEYADGETISSGLVVTESDKYTIIEDNGGSELATYTVTLKIKDAYKNNYEWITSSANASINGDTVVISYRIVKGLNSWQEGKAPAINSWTYGEAGNAGTATPTVGTLVIEYKVRGAEDSTYTTTLPTEAGNYTARFTVTDANHTDLVAWVDFTIHQKQVTAPTIADDKKEQSYAKGETLKSGLVNQEGYVVSDDGGINVGTYTATVSLASSNYIWSDGTSAPKTYTYEIVAIDNTEEITTSYNATYGNLLKDVVTLPAGVEGTWNIENFNTATVGNAGTRTFEAVFTPANNNYNSRTETITIVVEKATVTTPDVPNKGQLQYTGNKVESGAASTDLYTATDIGGVVVGKHQVKLSLKDANNYKWSSTDNSADIYVEYVEIIKAENNDVIPTYTATYGQKLSDITLRPTSTTGTWNWQDATQYVGNAGERTHTLVFTPSDTFNYASRTVEVTINVEKADATINGVNDSYNFAYTNTEFTVPTATATSGATVTTTIKKGDETVTVIKTVGTYVITYSAASNDNYNAVTKEVTVTIIKGTNAITEASISGWTFGQAGNTGSATATYGGIKIEYKLASADDSAYTETLPTAAGNYVARFTTTDTNCDPVSVTRTFTITKATVNVPGIADNKQSQSYTGSTLTSGLTVADDGLYTIDDDGGITVGGYAATLELKDKANYKWSSGDTDEDGIIELTYSIVQTKITVTTPTISGWTYGQSASVPQSTPSFTDGVTVTYEYFKEDNGKKVSIGNTAPTDAGTYFVVAKATTTNANLIASDASDYAVFSIAKKEGNWITGVANGDRFESENLVYRGSAYTIPEIITTLGKLHTETAAFSYSYTKGGEKVDNIINAGTYTVVITLEDSKNHKQTGSITVTVVIQQVENNDTIPTYAPTYGTLLKDLALPTHSQGHGTWSWKDATAETTVGNAGQQTHTLFFDSNDENYADRTVTVTMTVAKKQISVPEIADEFISQVYTGSKLTSGLTSGEGYTVVDDGGINVDDYYATITLDTTNYQWNDASATDTFQLKYSITPADNEWVVDPVIKGEWTYGDTDGLDEEALAQYKGTASATDGTVNIQYAPYGSDDFTDTFPTNAGKYVAKFTADSTNYTDLEKEIEFTILQKEVEVPSYTNTYVYTGEELQVVVQNPDWTLYSISGHKQTNAGDYEATLTLVDDDNYKWKNGDSNPVELSYSITKASVTLSDLAIEDWTYGKYNEETNKPTVKITQTFIGTVTAIFMYSTDGGETWGYTVPENGNAGNNYMVRALVAETANYYGDSISKNFTINKATVTTPSLTTDEFTYTGNLITSGFEAAADALYTSTDLGGTNVGNYSVKLTLKNKTNYKWSTTDKSDDIELSYEIVKADVTISTITGIDGWTYGDDADTPSATLKESYAQSTSEKITFAYFSNQACSEEYKLNAVPSNAGTYYVKAVFAGDNNLNEAESEPVSFTIAKQVVDTPTVPNASIPYNGQTQYSGLSTNNRYTVVDNGGTNVGDYSVKLTLKNKTNYKWSTTDKSDDIELSYEIVKADVTISTITGIDGWTYGDIADTPSATLQESYAQSTSEKITFAYFSNQACSEEDKLNAVPSNAGTYYVKAFFAGDNNLNEAESEPVSFTIAKATVTVPSYTNSFPYNDVVQKPTLADTADYTVAWPDENRRNVGTYHVTLTLKDSTNYKWSNGDEVSTELEYTITKGTITLSNLVVENATFGQELAPSVKVLLNDIEANNIKVTFKYYSDADCKNEVTPYNVGSYYVLASVAANGNNYDAASISRGFTISKAEASIDGVEDGKTYEVDYRTDGWTILQIISGLRASYNDASLTYYVDNEEASETTVFKDVQFANGEVTTRTVVISLAATDNYEAAQSVTVYIKINPARIVISDLTIADWTCGQSASEPQYKLNFTEGVNVGFEYFNANKVSIGNTAPTDAGTYYVVATATTSNNNLLASNASDFVVFCIAKATGSISVENDTYTQTYNGQAFTIPTATAVGGGKVTYTITKDGKSVDEIIGVGTYTITYSAAESANYAAATKTVTVTITEGTNEITSATISGWTYGEAGNTGSATATYGGVKIEYKLADADDSAYSTTLPTAAGSYVARFTTTDTNCDPVSVTRTFTITKAEVTPPTITNQGEVKYTGSKISSGFTAAADALYTATEDNAVTVGTYYVKLALKDKSNYMWSTTDKSDDLSIQFVKIIKGTVTLEGLSAGWTYGNFVTPTVTVKLNGTTVTNISATFTYSTTENGTYSSTVPTNAGNYYVKADIAGTTNYDAAPSVSALFSINQAEPTWTDPTFNTKYYENQFNPSVEGLSATFTKGDGSNVTVTGSFEYHDKTFVDGAGNSYIKLTFTPSGDDATNFKAVTRTYNVTFVTVAYLNNTTPFGRIEGIDGAIAAANAAVQAGAESAVVWVRPYNADLGPIYITENISINTGVTLLLPYGSDGTGRNTYENEVANFDLHGGACSEGAHGTGNALAGEDMCFVKVILANGKTITNYGTLEISGQLSGGGAGAPYAGHTAGLHARLLLDTNATINNYGVIRAAGFIYEVDGSIGSQVIINNGSTLYQPYVLKDYVSGQYLVGPYKQMQDGVPMTPFNMFLLMNVSPTVRINYGGNIITWAALYTGSTDGINTTKASFVGTGGIIEFTTEQSYLIAKYDPTTEVCKLDVYGGAKTNSMKLSVNVVITVTIDTKDALFPFTYLYDVTLHSGAYTMGQRFKMMPGAKLTVAEDATLDVDTLIVYDETFKDERTGVKAIYLYPANKGAAVFTVNGSATCGTLAGKVKSEVEGASVTINTTTSYTAYEPKTYADGKYMGLIPCKDVATRYEISANATLVNGDKASIVLPAKATTTTYTNGEWITTLAVHFDSNGGNAVTSITMSTNEAYPALPTPTKAHYVFAGWKDSDGNIVSAGDTLASVRDAVNGNTLIAQWTPAEYNLNYEWKFEGFDADPTITWAESLGKFTIETAKITLPTPTNATGSFVGWYTDAECGNVILNGTISGAELVALYNGNATIYGLWTKQMYAIKFEGDVFDDVPYTNDKVVYTPSTLPSAVLPTIPNTYETDVTIDKYFEGWYYNGTKVTDFSFINDSATEYTLTAKWVDKVSLTYTANDTSIYTNLITNGSETLTYGTTYWYKPGTTITLANVTENDNVVTDSSKLNYCKSWTLNGADFAKSNANTSYTLSENTVIHITWGTKTKVFVDSHSLGAGSTAIDGKFTLMASTTNSDAGKYYTATEVTNKDATYYVAPEHYIMFSVSAPSSTVPTTWTAVGTTEHSYQVDYQPQSCIVEGTLITLADGTQKKVEDLTHEDLLLIFNHETGKMEAGYVAMLDHLDVEREWTNVINFMFSNGETLRMVWSHGVFDVTLNKYVLVNEDNYSEFVGHQFYSTYYNGSEFVSELVTLTDAFITNEYIRVYNPTSYWHMNYFANGILNVTAAPADHVGGHVNIFELDEDMKYDAEQMQADIEKYGLYTYDDFAEYLTEEQFYALPFAYLKVAVGKGNIDWESIMQIVEYIKAGSLLD